MAFHSSVPFSLALKICIMDPSSLYQYPTRELGAAIDTNYIKMNHTSLQKPNLMGIAIGTLIN